MNISNASSLFSNLSTYDIVSDSALSTSNVGNQSKCDEKYPECQAANYLWLISIPIILLLGTIGNTLILIVMTRKPLRQTAFGRYLAAISISDSIAIWVGLGRQFIKYAWHHDIRHDNLALCWLQRFLLYCSLNTSVWLLTAVTFERTFSTLSPHRSRMFKSLKKTWIIIISLTVIHFLWNLQIFFVWGRGESADPDAPFKCTYVSTDAKTYWKNYYQYLALVDYSLLPFISMFIMNIIIFAVLKKRSRLLAQSANLSEHGKKSIASVSHKTLMLLPVTVFFLISTLPTVIFTKIEGSTETFDRERARMELADCFMTIFMYLNHSLNFFLYCLTGKMFRQKCVQVLQPIFCLFGKRKQPLVSDPTWETVYSRSPRLSPRISPRLSQKDRLVIHQNLPIYSSMLSVQKQQLDETERLYVTPSPTDESNPIHD